MMTSSIEFVNDVIIEEIASAKVKQVYNWEELKKVISYKLNTVISVYISKFNLTRFQVNWFNVTSFKSPSNDWMILL
jgi:hypothetical protein